MGLLAGGLAPLLVLLAPTRFVELQLTFLGSHSEAPLPFVLLLAAWFAWQEQATPGRSFGVGALASYCACFSYLLWPLLGVVALLALLDGPRRPGRWMVAGAAVGLTPLWLLLVLGGAGACWGASPRTPGRRCRTP